MRETNFVPFFFFYFYLALLFLAEKKNVGVQFHIQLKKSFWLFYYWPKESILGIYANHKASKYVHVQRRSSRLESSGTWFDNIYVRTIRISLFLNLFWQFYSCLLSYDLSVPQISHIFLVYSSLQPPHSLNYIYNPWFIKHLSLMIINITWFSQPLFSTVYTDRFFFFEMTLI